MGTSANIGRSFALAALIIGVSAPAFAAGEEKLTRDPKSGEYCYKALNTGSRVARPICQSRAQWAAEGIIIPEREKKLAKR